MQHSNILLPGMIQKGENSILVRMISAQLRAALAELILPPYYTIYLLAKLRPALAELIPPPYYTIYLFDNDPSERTGTMDPKTSIFLQTSKSSSGVVDLTGDEDPTDEDGDIGVSVSLGDEIFLEEKKSQESNIGDSDNTRDGGKTAGRAIIT
ncbi:hypothetical protein Tco_1345205 [Tanacetum coccineum]